MPRNGSDVFYYSTSAFVDGTTIVASTMNSKLGELLTDLNTARPIAVGGTGATSASGARTNLGLGTMAVEAAANYAALAGATFTGSVTVPNASADGHAVNRITGDGRYLQATNNWVYNATESTTWQGGTSQGVDIDDTSIGWYVEFWLNFAAGDTPTDLKLTFSPAGGGGDIDYDFFSAPPYPDTSGEMMLVRVEGFATDNLDSVDRTWIKIEWAYKNSSDSNFTTGSDWIKIEDEIDGVTIDTGDANDEFSSTGSSGSTVHVWERG